MSIVPTRPPAKKGKRLAGCLAVFLAGLAAMVWLAVWLDGRSKRDDAAARRFCAQVQVGEPLEAVVARALAEPGSPNVTVWGDELSVTWASGMFMHAATCRAEAVDGRIASTRVQIADN